MLDGLFFGTTFQCKRARRRRARGAVCEQEDEDAQGHDGQQATAAPAEHRAAEFVCSAPAEHQVCDRTPCGLRRLNPRERRATARGEGCERLNGFAPPRPLEAPGLVVHSAKGCPPTNARAHARTRREDRVRSVQRSPRVPAEARSGTSHQHG